jgi:hypothetical protein
MRHGCQLTVRSFTTRSLLLGIFAASVYAQPTLRIASPPNGFEVRPGQTLLVILEASSPNAFRSVMVGGDIPVGLAPAVGNGPYLASVQIPSDATPREYVLTGLGLLAPGHFVNSSPVTIFVERQDQPRRLRTEPSILMMTVGEQTPLQVIGEFRDGAKVDLTRSKRTIYICRPSSLASIDREGVVIAKAAGSGRITINGMIDIPISISPVSK